MAKNRQPIAKRCKALGISRPLWVISKKTTIRNPATVCAESSLNMQLSSRRSRN